MNKKEKKDFFVETEYLIIRITLLGLFIAGAAQVLTHEFSTVLTAFSNLDWIKTNGAIIVGAFGVMVSLISAFTHFLKRESVTKTSVKEIVIRAYASALEESNLNPKIGQSL